MIKSCCRLHFVFRKTSGLGRRIGIIRRALDTASSGPESGTAHFMRIRFSSNRISIGPRWRRTSAEARYRQIEASPEEMNGTGFADKAGAKFFEHGIAPLQDSPGTAHRVRIISGMYFVLLKGYGVGKLNRHRVNGDINPERVECSH